MLKLSTIAMKVAFRIYK